MTYRVRFCNWIRRSLGLRPVLVLHTSRDSLSRTVAAEMRRQAEARGYRVHERHLN